MPKEKQDSKLSNCIYAVLGLAITSTWFLPIYFKPEPKKQKSIIKQENNLERITMQYQDRTITLYKGSKQYDLALELLKNHNNKLKIAEKQ